MPTCLHTGRIPGEAASLTGVQASAQILGQQPFADPPGEGLIASFLSRLNQARRVAAAHANRCQNFHRRSAPRHARNLREKDGTGGSYDRQRLLLLRTRSAQQ